MKIILSLSFILITSAHAQLFSFGVKGGVPLLDSSYNHDESKRYIVGPSIELALPAGFAIEADALYQRLGNSSALLVPITVAAPAPGATIVAGFPLTTRQRSNAWEFPLLGKYYFHSRYGLQPFVSSGFSFRTISVAAQGINILTYTLSGPQTASFKSDYRTDLGIGAVAAAGLRFKVGHFSLLPEFRYTRWGSNDRVARKNSAGVYLGLSF